jgi:hypothetical protein
LDHSLAGREIRANDYPQPISSQKSSSCRPRHLETFLAEVCLRHGGGGLPRFPWNSRNSRTPMIAAPPPAADARFARVGPTPDGGPAPRTLLVHQPLEGRQAKPKKGRIMGVPNPPLGG